MTTRQFQESSALRIFLSYFKPHRKLFFLDMCCALMIAVIDLAFPYVSRWCMYQLLPESAYRTFFAVMAVVFCAYILRSVFTYIICYYGHTFGILVEADIRRDLFRHMQELSFDYYDRNRTGQLMSRLTADPVRHHGAGPPRTGGHLHLRRYHCGSTGHHVHHPVAAGSGDRLHHPGVLPGGVEVPQVHAGRLDQGEAADGHHQRRHRVGPLGHQDRQGLCQ